MERRQVDDRLLLVGMGKYMMEVTSASLVSRAQSLLTTAFSMVVGPGLTEKLIAIDMISLR